jgi:hypothetical protein
VLARIEHKRAGADADRAAADGDSIHGSTSSCRATKETVFFDI